MGRARHRAMRPEDIRRSIELSCGHPEGLATLHRSAYEGDEGPFMAWCPVCEAEVEFSRTVPQQE